MNRKTITVLILILFGERCFAQWPYQPYKWNKNHLSPAWVVYGEMEIDQQKKRDSLHVKTRTQYNRDTVEGIKEKVARYYYDRNGNVTRFELGDSILFERNSYEYNWKNQLMSEHDTDAGMVTHHVYTFNAEGNLSSDKIYDKRMHLTSITAYFYDQSENLISTSTRSDGIVSSSESFEYSPAGLVLNHFTYDAKHRPVVRKKYEYNQQGKLIRHESYIGIGADTLAEYFTYGWDSSGAINRMEHHYAGRKEYHWSSYGYDQSGRMITNKSMQFGSIYDKTFVYDNNGLEIIETRNVNTTYCTLLEYEFYEADSGIVLNNVFFESGKGSLLPTSFRELDSLGKYLAEHNGVTIEVIGHTDNVGNEISNQKLSENRAKSVADYLISRGIDRTRITYRGYGSSQPKALNDTEEGRRQNRRVEFVLSGK